MSVLDNKVIGLGYPRSGTSSLSAALQHLGLKIPHWCPITGGNGAEALLAALTSSHLNDWDGVVTSRCELYTATTLFQAFPDAYFIFTRRDEVKRRASLHNIAPSRSVYEYAEQDALSFLQENAKHLAILDLELESSEKWSLLCEFLGLDHPGDAYPHKNASEINYVI